MNASAMPFRFDGGRLSLDFAATVSRRRRIDTLTGPDLLAQWFVAAGLAEQPPSLSQRDVDQAIVVREALHRLIQATLADGAVDVEDVDLLDEAARVPLPAIGLGIGADGRLERRRAGPPTSAGPLLSVVARDAIELLTDQGALASLRTCAAPDCTMVYVDTTGRRHYCSSATCGVRTRVAAHRARLRA